MSRVDNSESVKVVVRCRPLNTREINDGHEKCVFVNTAANTVQLRNPKVTRRDEAARTFTFDGVYDESSTQNDLYQKTFSELICSVLDGFNGTIFAYGQTGTGKTHTIQGIHDDPQLRGVMPNSFNHIFSHIENSKDAQYLVRASYLEIYKEEVHDLLHPEQKKHLEIKERPDSGIYIKDLSSVLTKSIFEIQRVMNIGYQNRAVGFLKVGIDGQQHIRVGKLNLVDLAGSERQSKTLSEGERLKEATKINLSLSTLGNVISALVSGKNTHIPYRDSKLTRLLQDSLGGNAKTVMVANIGPATYNYEETLNTLRYANRAKDIKNRPKINEDPKDALLREYQEEIQKLKHLLKNRNKGILIEPHLGTEKSNECKRNESESDDDLADDEAYVKEKRTELEAERQAILSDQTLLSEEKEKLLEELKVKERKLSEEQAQTEQLESKLQAMESKVLRGGQSIVEHTRMQEATLAQQRDKIAEHRRREREIVAQMEAAEGNMANLQEGFSSLKQEVEVNSRRLKKLYDKFQEVRKEISDIQEQHIQERQEHERLQEGLTREVKLRLLLLENFVSVEQRAKLEKRAYFDEELEEWKLKPLAQARGVTLNGGDVQQGESVSYCLEPPVGPALGGRRPVSQYSRMTSKFGENVRFRGEQLLSLDLDLPCRTTRDYEPPELAPQVVAALEAALQDEEDLELDGSPSVFKCRPVKLKKRDKRISRHSAKIPETEEFPQSRGLVPK